MSDVTISTTEQGLVRVFALSLSDEAARDLVNAMEAEVPALLGVSSLDLSEVALFAIDDLGDMTLPEFLAEGHGIAAADMAPDRVKLTALQGWVLVIRTAAFDTPETLTLAPELTLIGTYQEPGVDWSDGAPLTSASATEPARKPVSNAAMSGRIASVALLLLFVFTALFIWIAA